MSRPCIVLANLGTPAAPSADAVREFLLEFLSDPLVVDWPRWLWQPVLRRIILRTRPSRVARLYQEIWWEEGSPLEVETARIRSALAATLPEWDVRTAYRYGKRSLSSIVEEVSGGAGGPPSDLGVEEVMTTGSGPIWCVPLFPQRTSSSSGSIVGEVQRLARKEARDLRICEIAPDDAGYVEALADRVRAALPGSGVDHLLLSYHGIPARYDRRESGQYSADCAATTDAVLRRLSWPRERATLCFQSRFGPERWIGPATADLLQELPGRGIKRVAVATPGFLTEGLETLEEIGKLGRSQFLGAGGEEFVRIASVADHPAFIDSLARSLERCRGTT